MVKVKVEKEDDGDLKRETRWRVTYTKQHIGQKRKVYQDGILLLHPSTNKLSLYDECEKLLECKVLSGEDSAVCLAPGGTVTFNSYLVDVGDPEAAQDRSVPEQNWSERPMVIRRQKFRSPTVTSSASNSNRRSENFGSLSPSRKIIRDFQKREMQRYGGQPRVESSTDAVEPSASEWQVLYTTQVTQKAKRYHDGFLRLECRGTFGRQVVLYNEHREVLTSRFLKKEETIKCGESMSFDGHLVDIGDPAEDCKPPGGKLDDHRGGHGEQKTANRHQSRPQSSIPIAKEWQAMYTNQVTGKAKRYQDGLLRLVTCGSLGRQIVLYDFSGRQLERRFLQKDETIVTGASIRLSDHLVDIGEAKQENQPPVDFNAQGIYDILGGKTGAIDGFSLSARNSVAKGDLQTQDNLTRVKETAISSSSERINMSKISFDRKPLRDASQILSILLKPARQENPVAGCHEKSPITAPSSTTGLQHSGRSTFGGFCSSDRTKEEKLDQCLVEDGVDDQQNGHNPNSSATRARSVLNIAEDSNVARSEEFKSSREVDDCPTFDLGF